MLTAALLVSVVLNAFAALYVWRNQRTVLPMIRAINDLRRSDERQTEAIGVQTNTLETLSNRLRAVERPAKPRRRKAS